MKIFLASLKTAFSCDSSLMCKYGLESFYTMDKRTEEKIKELDMFLLDSGAFSFMNSTDSLEINWDSYIEKYAEFINKNDIKYFFELDIDSIVGIKEVERLRAKLEKLTNKKCIPVWHRSRGFEYWKQMCKDYDYVAIGGIVTREIKRKDYDYFIPMLKIAKENNCKVHGLGFTNLKLLKKYNFFSVDSTSWIGGRYGTLQFFDGKTIKSLKKEDNRKLKSTRTVNVFNFKEWVKFQKYFDNIG